MVSLANLNIYLDTNFLVYCIMQKIDYINELKRIIDRNFELIIPSQVEDELIKLSKKGKTKEKIASKIALKEIKKFKKGFSEGYVDNALIDLALHNKPSVVCTNDKSLKKN